MITIVDEGCNWCGESVPYPRRRYCSHRCKNAALMHAADVMEAHKNGDEIPEKPSKDEAKAMMERTSKWTPTRMRDRIAEFKRKLDTDTDTEDYQ